MGWGGEISRAGFVGFDPAVVEEECSFLRMLWGAWRMPLCLTDVFGVPSECLFVPDGCLGVPGECLFVPDGCLGVPANAFFFTSLGGFLGMRGLLGGFLWCW